MRVLICFLVLLISCTAGKAGEAEGLNLIIVNAGTDARPDLMAPALRLFPKLHLGAWVDVEVRSEDFNYWWDWYASQPFRRRDYVHVLFQPPYHDGYHWIVGGAGSRCTSPGQRLSISSFSHRALPASLTAFGHELGHQLGAGHAPTGTMQYENGGDLFLSAKSKRQIQRCLASW